MNNKSTLLALTLVYIALFIFCAIEPASRAVWFAEIIPVVGFVLIIWRLSMHYTFSHTAYILMFVWVFLHTIGAKYTFSEVPFEWFNQLIGSERNNFDRVGHFSIGFYAYAIAEYLINNKKLKQTFACCFALFAIMSLAAGYEIIEWWYAELAGGEEGIAFLGSQGDIWDAQKDMLCDTLGAISSLTLLLVQRRWVASR